MKNTRQALVALLFALLATIFVLGCSGNSDDEEEEEAETYSVYDVADLLEWAAAAEANPKVNCTLYADIDMSGYTWTPICSSYSNGYAGKFDGNGHVISNLTISSSKEHYVGFFGYVIGGRVENLGLEDVSIKGYIEDVGGIAGNNGSNLSTITGCYSNASVLGSMSYGGIAGQNVGSVSSCYWNGVRSGVGSTTDGVGRTTDGASSDTTKVDGSSVTWDNALSAMNSAISSSGYQYVLNTDDDTKDDEPLKLTKS